MLAVLIVIVWKYFGFHMMLFIAALQGMDQSLIEAARIDGATRLAGAALCRHPAALSDDPALGVLRHRRLAAAVRSGHAADARRAGGFLEHAGDLPLQQRHLAHAGRLSAAPIGVILFVICVTFAFTYKRWFMRDE